MRRTASFAPPSRMRWGLFVVGRGATVHRSGRPVYQAINAVEKHMCDKHGYMKALKCRECGREYKLEATHVCEFDFGPLEVAYDYDRIKKALTKAAIESRTKTMWRYRELLPVATEPT